MTIEKIETGYLVTITSHMARRQHHFATLQELFQFQLMYLAGRSQVFGNDSFGEVFVADKPGQVFTAKIT